MLKKVSGAKSVFVRLQNVGRNYLPFVEDLKDRTIRYIDVVPVTSLPFPFISDSPVATFDGLYISVAEKQGNGYPIYALPLDRLDISQNMGRRQPVNRVSSISDCYIDCEDPALIGQIVCLVFWYDLADYSAPDSTVDFAIDSVEVDVLSSQQNNVFPDNRTMAGKRFRHISFPAVSPTISGATGLSKTEMLDCYVSFVKGNYAVIDNIPLSEFYDVTEMYETLLFANICFDFTNSFVTVGGTANYDGRKVMFNLTYENK